MPKFSGQWEQITGNCLIAQQHAYDPTAERDRAEQKLFKLSKLNLQCVWGFYGKSRTVALQNISPS